jgi:signal transduction histidine kinase/ActR/RegA family two-component response regulator
VVDGGGGAAGRLRDELEQLRRDLAEVRDQQAATSGVLATLGRSASNLDAVLETVVDSARRLCRADVALIFLLEGAAYRLAFFSGVLTEENRAYLKQHPLAQDRGTLAGRVGLERRPQQIADVLADPEYGRPDIQRHGGYRTTMGVPMLLDGEVVGVLVVWRTKVDPFSERAIELLTTFAAQAAIAIRTVDLFQTLEARTAELGRKVDQLEALSAVGQAVSSSLDLDEVLTTIVTHAVRLSDTDGGSALEFDPSTQEFRARTAYGMTDEQLEALRRVRIGLRGTLVGRAATRGKPESVADLLTAPDDPHLRRLREAGWRSLVVVPMLHESGIVGALVVRRRTPGDFPEETRDLLEAFASQSALAIIHARLFRELESKTAELEVASRHKSEFLASMSHELRTPLNAVIGFSEVLLERMFGELNDRQEEYLRDIWSSGKHLLELLNEILDLSKVEAGHMILESTEFSLQEALEHSLALVRERANRHGIALHLDVAPDVGQVQADELRVKQVIVNLLSNAVKFTPDGGRVDVRARADPSEVLVTVSDTGVGVAAEDRERIFDAFQQGGRTAPPTEGTGLGLTLSKRIVELHGGRIWVDSKVGVGSTFGFAIPAGAPVTATDAGAAGSESSGGGRTVVIIDDDRRSVDLLTVHLEAVGLRVVSARDGERGVELIKRLQPATVVLDILLPGLDGWQVLESLKADPVTAPIPVIVVSILDERARGLALGATEYLVKPVSREVVLEALARCEAEAAWPTS